MNETRPQREGSYPHAMLFSLEGRPRRVTKAELWQQYWKINGAKASLLLSHSEISTNRAQKDFAQYLVGTWQQQEEPVSWGALHLVYI